MKDLDLKIEIDAEIVKEVNESLKSMSAGDKCTLHDLLSKTFLKCFEGLHTAVGRRLSFLIRKKHFPLIFSGYTTDRHNEYIVISK